MCMRGGGDDVGLYLLFIVLEGIFFGLTDGKGVVGDDAQMMRVHPL